MKSSDASSLCLECGLCCNGVIFGHGQLQPGDDVQQLRELGLRLKKPQAETRNPKFLQPCATLDGCRCQIYADRPKYCREFDCLLLQGVLADRVGLPAARRRVRFAIRRVEKVKRLLAELGDTDESVALSLRFRRVKRRLEMSAADAATAERYGRLTLAMHDLNLLLGENFYR